MPVKRTFSSDSQVRNSQWQNLDYLRKDEINFKVEENDYDLACKDSVSSSESDQGTPKESHQINLGLVDEDLNQSDFELSEIYD